MAGPVRRGSDRAVVWFCFLDPIVQRLVIRSSTSEGLLLNLGGILPQVEKAEEEEARDADEDEEEKPVHESAST